MKMTIRKFILCFAGLSLVFSTFSTPLAFGEQNSHLKRIKENITQLQSQQKPENNQEQLVKGIVQSIYSFTNAVPYQISLKNILSAGKKATPEKKEEILQKKKSYFLSMCWIILTQAGLELKQNEDSIVVQRGNTHIITLRADAKGINAKPVSKEKQLDICIHYPPVKNKKMKYPFCYDYTTSLLGANKPKKPTIQRDKAVHEEKIHLQDHLEALVSGNDTGITKFEQLISTVFSSIPSSWHVDREAYYHSLFHVYLNLNNTKIISESCSSDGRIDSVVKVGKEDNTKTVIFEFKRRESTGLAAKQVMDTGYYSQVMSDPINPEKEIYFVGCRFKNKQKREKELEPTAWPFKCTATEDTVLFESLRGSQEDRTKHTYTYEDLSQMEKKSIGITPKKAEENKSFILKNEPAKKRIKLTDDHHEEVED